MNLALRLFVKFGLPFLGMILVFALGWLVMFGAERFDINLVVVNELPYPVDLTLDGQPVGSVAPDDWKRLEPSRGAHALVASGPHGPIDTQSATFGYGTHTLWNVAGAAKFVTIGRHKGADGRERPVMGSVRRYLPPSPIAPFPQDVTTHGVNQAFQDYVSKMGEISDGTRRLCTVDAVQHIGCQMFDGKSRQLISEPMKD